MEEVNMEITDKILLISGALGQNSVCVNGE
jgi:hypothetical protein